MDTHKENGELVQDPPVNVRSAAIAAMAVQINGSANSPKKRSSGSRRSDGEEIESLYRLIDNAEALFSLAADVGRYLSSIAHNNDTVRQHPAPTGLSIDVLEFVSSAGRDQLKEMRAEINSTKAKSRATQSNSKLNKSGRQYSNSQSLQSRALAPAKPREMLLLSLKSPKEKINMSRQPALAAELVGMVLPRHHRQNDVSLLPPSLTFLLLRNGSE
mmetsp:Transcript_5918/g.14827  ORF Transcript_5918/g.14827 Transcript_5918/m.14827 type:complete len:216 (+) Transcript_5918:1745-2392(+)